MTCFVQIFTYTTFHSNFKVKKKSLPTYPETRINRKQTYFFLGHISLGGLFDICENGGGGSIHPLKNYGRFYEFPLND